MVAKDNQWRWNMARHLSAVAQRGENPQAQYIREERYPRNGRNEPQLAGNLQKEKYIIRWLSLGGQAWAIGVKIR